MEKDLVYCSGLLCKQKGDELCVGSEMAVTPFCPDQHGLILQWQHTARDRRWQEAQITNKKIYIYKTIDIGPHRAETRGQGHEHRLVQSMLKHQTHLSSRGEWSRPDEIYTGFLTASTIWPDKRADAHTDSAKSTQCCFSTQGKFSRVKWVTLAFQDAVCKQDLFTVSLELHKGKGRLVDTKW